ncbi:MAG: HD domain-containing protein [Oscillospiraceae bacterium]|jgi:HD-GYP domain-containing protein (c-di-GMP phosphodiesterase class II)|nr:HD domain-containing protein [Oscillospiraceae bacterium]
MMATVEVSVDVDVLKADMRIKNRIVFERNGKTFFICKDVLLTDEFIEKIKKIIAPVTSVYISFEDYKRLFVDIEESPYETPYKYVKFETSNMFEDIGAGSHTSSFVADNITGTVREHVKSIDLSLIIQSINGIRSADEYIVTHSTNVALLNGIMGKQLNYDDNKLYAVIKTGLLHDIGMLKVPQSIVNKPGRLKVSEFDIIKKHVVFSRDMLVEINEKDDRILDGVLQHHERENGTGYLHGLNSSEICEFAKITAIADAYDAMITKRIYRDFLSPFKILHNFSRGAYSELDIKYVRIFVECMRTELQGKYVLMSDGTIARICLVLQDDLMYPIVQIGNMVIHTSPELYCISMYNGEDSNDTN